MRDTHKSHIIEKITNKENLPLEVLSMDIDNDNSVKNAIHKILDEKKKIDILVNNAGYGLFGALEDIAIEEIKNNLRQISLEQYELLKKFYPQ
jgi:short-subunit dehydrogenase